MAEGCPWSRVPTERRGMASGCWVCRSLAHAHPFARPCRAVAPCATCPAPRACGEHGTRTGGSRVCAARSRPPHPPLVWPGAAAQRCLSRCGPVAWRSHWRLLVSAGAVPLGRPALPPVRRWCLSRTAGPHPARQIEPGGRWVDAGGGRGRAVGVPPASADAARSSVALRVSPTCTGVGGTVPTVSRLSKRVSRVRRGRAVCVPRGVPQEGAPWGQLGQGRPGVEGAAGPNKGLQATANSLRSCLAPAIAGA